MGFPYKILRPLFFHLDAEKAHNLTLKALQYGLTPKIPVITNPALTTTLWNRKFPNPVGLAAGFDKNAAVVRPMLNLGFGFVEAGTVTPKPQAGNPKPRVFRDPPTQSVINAMGFPNSGLSTFKTNLEKFLEHRPRPSGLIGINIGMNKNQKEPVKDYALLIRTLGPFADYLTVNISSPNTPGLRDLQKKENLLPLLMSLKEERDRSCSTAAPTPLLIKLAPDLNDQQQDDIATTVIEADIDGLILTNTTLARPQSLPPAFAAHKGGLSGKPLKDASTEIIHNFYRLTGGSLPIIGLGGITTGQDAYAKIRAGASLVQLYTALVFHGPAVVKNINKQLLHCLKRDGFSHIMDAVGADHKTGHEEHDKENIGQHRKTQKKEA